ADERIFTIAASAWSTRARSLPPSGRYRAPPLQDRLPPTRTRGEARPRPCGDCACTLTTTGAAGGRGGLPAANPTQAWTASCELRVKRWSVVRPNVDFVSYMGDTRLLGTMGCSPAPREVPRCGPPYIDYSGPARPVSL